MSQIEAWLGNRILNADAIKKFVGLDVFPVWAPQNALYPFVTFIRVGTERQYCSGAAAQSDDLPRATFHIHCWDSDYFRLKDGLEDAVRQALDGARVNSGTNLVASCFITDQYDIPEPITQGREFPAFGTRFVVEITYLEPVLAN